MCSSECLVVPRPLWSSIRSWLEPGLNTTSPFCTLSDVLVPPPRRLSSHPASASSSSSSSSSSSPASTPSSSSNQEEKPEGHGNNSTVSESENEGKGEQEKGEKKAIDVPRRLTCPLRTHFPGGLRSRRRLLSTDVKPAEAMGEPLDSLASSRAQQEHSHLSSGISFSLFSSSGTGEPFFSLLHEGDASSSSSVTAPPTASDPLTAEKSVSSFSPPSDFSSSSSSFDVSSGSSPRSLSPSSSSSSHPSGGLSLLGLVEEMASSLFGLHTRPSLPVLSFTLRSSLESEPVETLQAAGTEQRGGERHLGQESDASTMEKRRHGEKENLVDELRIDLPLEQLVINDPQTGGREALCVVPQPYSLLTREGRTIRMGTRGQSYVEPISSLLSSFFTSPHLVKSVSVYVGMPSLFSVSRSLSLLLVFIQFFCLRRFLAVSVLLEDENTWVLRQRSYRGLIRTAQEDGLEPGENSVLHF